MGELFDKKDLKELNPTVKAVVSMSQSERDQFKEFAERMNLSFSAFIRMACKSFMQGEGAKYATN